MQATTMAEMQAEDTHKSASGGLRGPEAKHNHTGLQPHLPSLRQQPDMQSMRVQPKLRYHLGVKAQFDVFG